LVVSAVPIAAVAPRGLGVGDRFDPGVPGV